MNNNIKKPILLILLKPNYLNIHKVIISSSSKSNYKKAYKTKNDINCKLYKINSGILFLLKEANNNYFVCCRENIKWQHDLFILIFPKIMN